MKVLCGGSIAPKGRIRIYDLIRIPGDQIVIAARPPGYIELKSTRDYVELVNTHEDANALYTVATVSKLSFHLGTASGSLAWLLGKARADILVPNLGEPPESTVKKESGSR